MSQPTQPTQPTVATCVECNDFFDQSGFRKSEWVKHRSTRVCNNCYDDLNPLLCSLCNEMKSLNHFAVDQRHVAKCAQCIANLTDLFCWTCNRHRPMYMFAKVNRQVGTSKCNACVSKEDQIPHLLQDQGTQTDPIMLPDLYLSPFSTHSLSYSNTDSDEDNLLYQVD